MVVITAYNYIKALNRPTLVAQGVNTGSFATPGGIERVSKIVMYIGTKLCGTHLNAVFMLNMNVIDRLTRGVGGSIPGEGGH